MCWQCKCGTKQNLSQTKIIITAEPTLPFQSKEIQLYPILPLSISSFETQTWASSCFLLVEANDNHALCNWCLVKRGRIPWLEKACPFISFSLWASLSIYFHLGPHRVHQDWNFLPYCQFPCFWHAWVLGFQLVCLNCAIFFVYLCFMRLIYVWFPGRGFCLYWLVWVWVYCLLC